MKKKIFISLLAVAITAVAYSVIWRQAASKFEQYLMGMIDDFKKHGADIAYDYLTVKGFPFKLVATLKNPQITKNNLGSVLIKVDGNILVQTSIFGMTKLKYSTQGVTQFSYLLDKAHKPSWLLTAQHLDGEIDLWRQGFNRTAAMTLRDVQMISGDNQAIVENICINNFQTQLPTHLRPPHQHPPTSTATRSGTPALNSTNV